MFLPAKEPNSTDLTSVKQPMENLILPLRLPSVTTMTISMSGGTVKMRTSLLLMIPAMLLSTKEMQSKSLLPLLTPTLINTWKLNSARTLKFLSQISIIQQEIAPNWGLHIKNVELCNLELKCLTKNGVPGWEWTSILLVVDKPEVNSKLICSELILQQPKTHDS